MAQLLLAFIVFLAIAGCGEQPEAEALAGSFEARVEGVLLDTLRGEATYGTDAEGRVTGFELNAGDSTEGLSFELEPLPPVARYYVVPQRRPGGETPIVRAYLDVRDHSFRATAGTLRVERVSARRLEGTFLFQMEAPVEVPYDEAQPITVSGRFDAAPAPSPPATE